MKKIFLLIFPLILCGCSVDYTLNINDNNSLEEIAIFKEPNLLEKGDNVYFNNRGIHSSLMEKYKGFSANAKYINEGKDYQVVATRNSTSINSILNEYKDLIENYSYSGIANKKLTFEIKESVFDNYKPDTLKLNIKIPYKVTSSNSDESTGNYYTWNITKEKRKINMEFNTMENKTKLSDNSNDTFKTPVIILIAILLFSFILIPFVILLKKER